MQSEQYYIMSLQSIAVRAVVYSSHDTKISSIFFYYQNFSIVVAAVRPPHGPFFSTGCSFGNEWLVFSSTCSLYENEWFIASSVGTDPPRPPGRI